MKKIILLILLSLSTWASATVVTDPINDTVPGALFTLDLTRLEGQAVGDDLFIRMDFNHPIEQTDAGENNSLFGFVDIFTDQNLPPTGDYCQGFAVKSVQAWGSSINGQVQSPFQLVFFPDGGDKSLNGVDFQVGLYDENGLIETVPTTWGADFVEVRVPLSSIADDGIADLGTFIGDQNNATDCAPNTSFLRTDIAAVTIYQVPTLNLWGMLLLTLLMLGLTLKSYRKRA